VVEAYVGGVKKAETNVDNQGEYSLLVSGTAGAEVTFRVGGILANESATWESGAVDELDLTIATPPVVQYDLTVDSSDGGSVTDPGEGVFPYDEGTVVDLLADPEAGYQFVNWTGDTGDIDDADAADTFITMNDDYAITANFELITPPTNQKLIGADDAAGSQQSVGYFTLCKFTAVATGNMTEFRVKSSVAGNVKCAIYADSAGEPGALITAMDTGQAVDGLGWNTLNFTSTSITSGTVYWLAFMFSIQGAVDYRTLTGTTRRYKAGTYTGWTFPNPAGTGFSSTVNYADLEAGWGSTVAPEKPLAPTRNCSTLTFRWNASAGATKYWLQVNTSTDFAAGTSKLDDDKVGNVTYREETGLTAGTTYYYRVKAGNAGGWSGWSSTGSMRCGGVL
jgi:hypothetical protein